MRFSTLSVAAVAALTSLVANATPTPTSVEDLCVAEICYGQPAEALTAALNADPSAKATSSFSERHLSNAERISRGLPVNRPSRLFKEGKRANASPSVVPQTTFQGYLQVSNAETNEDIGFISKNWLSGGAYPRFQETLDEDALLIRFNLPTGAESGTDVEFQIDGFSFPYFGLIQGRDSTDSSLAAGSYNYLYLGATAQTPVSSVPVFVGNSYSTVTGLERTSESAVWTVDAVSGEVFPQWTNPDETLPVIEQFTQSTTFYFTADTAAFVARYPAPTVAVKYTFVPI